MKTIGLIGGMSWESTLKYYRIINQGVKNQLGGLHSAKIILNSVDFDEIEQLQHNGDWGGAAKILADAAISLEASGADFFLICTNTMHKVAPEIEKSVNIPLLHIADATAETLSHDGIETIGLLGTKFTMEQDFYKGRLTRNFNLNVITPNDADMDIIHNIIYNELCLGDIQDSSKVKYMRIINELSNQGAEAVILGCTEIGMLVSEDDIKLYDTTLIHANKAVEYALN